MTFWDILPGPWGLRDLERFPRGARRSRDLEYFSAIAACDIFLGTGLRTPIMT